MRRRRASAQGGVSLVVASLAGTGVFLGALLSAAGCSGRAAQPQSPPATQPPSATCARVAERSPVEAVCAADADLRALRARFRAQVTIGAEKRDAEGVLVLQRPAELRFKLFTLVGFTVYDALWTVRDGDLKGYVSLPLADREVEVSVVAGEPIVDPEVGLSLALWSLWQPRCVAPPVADAAHPERYALDPASARAASREVTVAAGEIREEVLVPGGGLGRAGGRVIARYGDMDCALAIPLPRRILLEAPEQGWSASVRILEIEENPTLDPRLFAPPSRKDGSDKA